MPISPSRGASFQTLTPLFPPQVLVTNREFL